MAQSNPFDQFDSAPKGVLTGPPPDPMKVAGERRDEIRTGIAVEGAGRDARNEGRQVTKQNFDQEAKLRDDFSQNLEVKAYKASIPVLASALHAPKTGQGDLSVIYAYAKIMDPNSVVREGEMNMVVQSSPAAAAMVQNLQNQLDGSGRLPEKTRQRLEQEMIRATAARKKSYETQYDSFSRNAQSYGLDPMRVVGPREGLQFRDEMQSYDKEHKLGRFGDQPSSPPDLGGGPRDVNKTGGIATGTQIQFGMDKPEEAFDRAAYVQQHYGITPDQEDLIIGFWNQNRENAGLTVDGAKEWYQKNNLPVPPDDGLATMVQDAQKGYQFGPFDTSQGKAEYEAKLNQFNQGRTDMVGEAARDPNSATGLLDRAKTGASLNWRDEIAGIGGAIGNVIAGENPIEGYKTTRDADRLLQEQEREKQGVPGHIAEFVGSIPTALALPSARAPGIANAIKSGATLGTIAGAGHGEGVAGTLINGGAGGVIGGALGGALSGGGTLLSKARGVTSTVAPEVVAAGEKEGVRVLTTDVAEPTTSFGKFVRRAGELTPFLGTGGQRAAQRAERETAVRNLIAEYGDGTIDDVSDNLVETRGNMIKNLVAKKDKVIDGIADPVPPIALRNTLRTIDIKIAELTRANPKKFAPVIDELNNFREVLQSGKSLREVEMNRKLLGDVFADPSLASVRGDGQKALNAIYGPLREDMGAFIKAKGGNAAFNRWKTSNDKLSSMMGELESTAFKRLLNSAETTPEQAGSILFGKKPSDIKRLYNSLSDTGVKKGQAAILNKAFEAAKDGENISPKNFVNTLQKLDDAVKIFFPGAEKARLDGFVKLITATQRAVEGTSMPNNGAQLAVPVLTAMLSTIVGPKLALPVGGFLGTVARGYESKLIRNMLMKMGQAAPGSPAETNAAKRIIDAIIAGGETRRTPANDVAAERIGEAFGNSTTAAAANEQEQDGRRKPIRY